MAANQTSSLLKLNQFAKDINMKTKDVVGILEEKGITAKSQKVLEPVEFEILFEVLTKENQITNIEDYLDGREVMVHFVMLNGKLKITSVLDRILSSSFKNEKKNLDSV